MTIKTKTARGSKAEPKAHSHTTKKRIRVKHFFASSVKTFSLYDNVRSIPKLTDGMKPSQRKVLYGTVLRGENQPEIQVERLASLIAAHTDYHHGATSLVGTMVGMAANKMPGMNNMNLLMPNGQFGSRLTKEAGAGRYIMTELSPAFRQLFKKEDDCILESLFSDGEPIEPVTYIPLLPMSLVNGASGTGTGHACEIYSYHPEAVRDAVLKVVEGKKVKAGTLTPWFRGYHGTVTRNAENGQVMTTGNIEILSPTELRITELPLGVYLDPYKEFLNDLEEQGFIKQYDDRSTEEGFRFDIIAPRSTTALDMETLLKKFKLIGRGTENFTLWNPEGKLQKYESAEDVIAAFVPWRLARYEDRRQKLIVDTTEQIRFQSEKLRFVLFYLDNVDLFKSKKKADLVALLKENDFSDYEKLLALSIWHLTFDVIEKLKKELDELKKYLASLQKDTAAAMYKRELIAFSYEQA